MRENNDYILIIVDLLMKMVYYEPVKVTINNLKLAKVIINIVVLHYSPLDSVISNKGLLFTSKFYSLLYYFFKFKYRLSTIFSSQTDGQTKY